MLIYAYGTQRIPYRVLERTETTVTLSTPRGAVTKPLSDVLGTIELKHGVKVELTTTPGREYVFLQEFEAPTEFKDGVQEYEDWVYLQAPSGDLAVWKLNQIHPILPPTAAQVMAELDAMPTCTDQPKPDTFKNVSIS